MKERKIIFLDVDGTLVDYEGRIPKSAIQAIRAARKGGHRVYICTGRSKAEVYQELWDIGLDGMIGGNGSYVEDGGHVVLHQLITKEQCVRIVEKKKEKGLEFYLESNSGVYASEHFAEKAQPAVREYSRRKGRDGAEHMTVSQAFPDMIYGAGLYRDDLNKISYLLDSYQDFLDAKEQFADMENGTWGGAGETALFGDLGVKGITKGNAAARLLDYLGAKQEDTIAFGDGPNDFDMLEYAAVGVAMGNAVAALKDRADYIAAGVDEDGVARALQELGLVQG